eukprot:TRINITY_DN10374_c0_g1_i2.p1 TRINITY_DN10374_c0_g1~~TRINITY_DN10374_c0_g1_i2.p1  ORF type:complete len:327 (-),score=99.64 TRINITY_DN10374_c0_g1_i2:893-1849(-)
MSDPPPPSAAAAAGGDGEKPKRPKRNYRKPKPWDTDDIDHWKIEPFEKGAMSSPLLEESSFATLFPRYREKYLRETWPLVTKELAKHGVACELNLREGSMTVKTTRKTWDPWAIMNARDFIKLLSRSVPFQQAVKIFQDDIACDIVKIGNVTRNKERFVKRRQRLLGPHGQTLKAIELLTDCYVLVQGNTVSCMGAHKGLKIVRRIIDDTMRNIHPIYNIKQLMIKRELAKDPAMAEQSWDRFLPKFKKKNVQRKKVKIIKKKRSLYPPAPTPRKVDLEMETGEFFMKEEERKEKHRQEKAERKKQKEEVFSPTLLLC